MGLALENEILQVLQDTQRAIQANMDARGVNASGRTRASIRVEQYDGGVRLIGGNNATHTVQGYPHGTLETGDTAPIPTLEVGRVGGGNPPVQKGFYYIIKEWSRDKGITFANESERSTFAYFLARKIAKSGTLRSRNHVDIYSTPVNQAVGKINAVLNNSLARTVREALGISANVTHTETHF